MMKKSGSIIEAAAGAVIFVIGLVLCFHNYVPVSYTHLDVYKRQSDRQFRKTACLCR